MNNNNDLKEFFSKNGFSIAICSTVAILLVATLYFSYSSFQYSEQNNTLVENENNTDFEAVNKSDVKSYKESTTEKITETTTTKNQVEKATETTTNSQTSNSENKSDDKNTVPESQKTTKDEQVFNLFDESQEMSWPVSGQIVMDYSIETAIYDKTLEQFKTNDSISISAPEGTDVMASTEGIVENIFEDFEKGKTVVLNHGNGWKSTYSQLQNEVNVEISQVVKEGQVIGKIGSPSNYGVGLGPHLNFKITKDDISSDPKVVLAQLDE